MARKGILVQQIRLLRLGSLHCLRRAIYSTINHSGLLPEQERDTNGGATTADNDDDDGTKSQVRIKHSVCLPTVCTPKSLELAQENLLTNYPNKQLVSDGAALMKYLRTRQPPSVHDQKMKQKKQIKAESANLWKDHTSNNPETIQAPLRYGKREGIACVAMRSQAGYGVCLRVFSEVAKLQPKFNPQVMLDFGSGVGTALWAAQQVWGESLYEYQAIDSSQDMGELARGLRVGGRLSDEMGLPVPTTEKEAISGVHFKQYLPVSNKVQYDLVVAANTLAELSTVGIRRSTIASLWRKTGNILVLIEFGTRAGYNVINEARDLILNASNWTKSVDTGTSQLAGHILAPCPHDKPCPLSVSKYYCSFAQRVQLSPAQRHTGLRRQGYYTEPFSYLVMKKGPRPTEESDPQSRLILPAMKRTRHVRCNLCCPNGKAKLVILTKSKADKELYRRARKSNWGDTLAVPHNMYDDDTSSQDISTDQHDTDQHDTHDNMN